MKMSRTNIHLTEEQKKAITRIAKKMRETKAEIVRRAVDEYIDRRRS